MVPEDPLRRSEYGLLPTGAGWYVLNARDAEWRTWGKLQKWPRLEGDRPVFEQLGVALTVLEPGQPMGMYHWETDQEDFLVLLGEAIAVVEGQERPLRRWDLLHCPPETNHVIVGAGDGPCIVFAVGSRQNHTYRTSDGQIDGREDWGAYTADDAARRHGAAVDTDTNDASVAYRQWPERVSARYEEGWLPG